MHSSQRILLLDFLLEKYSKTKRRSSQFILSLLLFKELDYNFSVLLCYLKVGLKF
ncbi:unnamed protein product [Moneuplotes crassus]|uniref:Uncharacterized protein n=1 Tax=Euplotes crassus TaxID=5936 RepID=A0AAD1XZ44_EUPCR|nr:unnamed protein product [Moneuplotes crassus]